MRSREKKTITLVLGGARSGKSRYAQTLASRRKKVTYIATARPRDPEMRRKIARHRRQRPSHWKTAEVSRNLGKTIQEEGPKADVLIIEAATGRHRRPGGFDGGRHTPNGQRSWGEEKLGNVTPNQEPGISRGSPPQDRRFGAGTRPSMA